jgi:hypothetical protein
LLSGCREAGEETERLAFGGRNIFLGAGQMAEKEEKEEEFSSVPLLTERLSGV